MAEKQPFKFSFASNEGADDGDNEAEKQFAFKFPSGDVNEESEGSGENPGFGEFGGFSAENNAFKGAVHDFGSFGAVEDGEPGQEEQVGEFSFGAPFEIGGGSGGGFGFFGGGEGEGIENGEDNDGEDAAEFSWNALVHKNEEKVELGGDKFNPAGVTEQVLKNKEGGLSASLWIMNKIVSDSNSDELKSQKFAKVGYQPNLGPISSPLLPPQAPDLAKFNAFSVTQEIDKYPRKEVPVSLFLVNKVLSLGHEISPHSHSGIPDNDSKYQIVRKQMRQASHGVKEQLDSSKDAERSMKDESEQDFRFQDSVFSQIKSESYDPWAQAPQPVRVEHVEQKHSPIDDAEMQNLKLRVDKVEKKINLDEINGIDKNKKIDAQIKDSNQKISENRAHLDEEKEQISGIQSKVKRMEDEVKHLRDQLDVLGKRVENQKGNTSSMQLLLLAAVVAVLVAIVMKNM